MDQAFLLGITSTSKRIIPIPVKAEKARADPVPRHQPFLGNISKSFTSFIQQFVNSIDLL